MKEESTSPVLFRETLRAVPQWLGTLLVLTGVAGAAAILRASGDYLGDPLFWLAAGPGVLAAVLAPTAIACTIVSAFKWRIFPAAVAEPRGPAMEMG